MLWDSDICWNCHSAHVTCQIELFFKQHVKVMKNMKLLNFYLLLFIFTASHEAFTIIFKKICANSYYMQQQQGARETFSFSLGSFSYAPHCFYFNSGRRSCFHLGLKTLHIGIGKEVQRERQREINKCILKFKSKFLHYVYTVHCKSKKWIKKEVKFICTCSWASRKLL